MRYMYLILPEKYFSIFTHRFEIFNLSLDILLYGQTCHKTDKTFVLCKEASLLPDHYLHL